VSLTDARDSGAIEDSADFLLGAWRPELRPSLPIDELAEVEGFVYFRLLKARRGARRAWRMRFDGKTMRAREQR